MNFKYIIGTAILFIVNNILIWYQLNGQLVWDFWKSKPGIAISLLMGIPITGFFWLATKYGYQGFGSLWAVRFMGFATSMITFPILTWMYLGESITMKTFITIILSFVIMAIQLLPI